MYQVYRPIKVFLYQLCFVKFQITQKLKSLPQTVPTLLQEVLGRIETDLGKELVSTAMSLLVCAREGEFCISRTKQRIYLRDRC